MKPIPIFLILLFLIFDLSCKTKNELSSQKIPSKTTTPFVVIKNETLYIEISDREKERATGLMYRDKLDDNKGMLFLFDTERILSFWMKNTKIPLSIAFLNSKKIIIDIQNMKPLTEAEHRSRFSAIYALEVNKGWFKRHNVGVGDTVFFHFGSAVE